MTHEEFLEKVERYHSGDLANNEREAFFGELLQHEDLYNSFAERQILADLLADPRIKREAHATLAEAKPLIPRFRSLRLAPIGLVPLAVVMAFVVFSLVHRNLAKSPEITRPSSVAWRSASTNAALPQRPISHPQPQVDAKTPDAQSRAFAFVLFPGKRGVSSGNVLRLMATVDTVLLEIPLQDDSSQRYSVRLATVLGKTVADFSGLRLSSLPGNGRGLRVPVPSHELDEGDYIVTVSIPHPFQNPEELAGFGFRVIRQH